MLKTVTSPFVKDMRGADINAPLISNRYRIMMIMSEINGWFESFSASLIIPLGGLYEDYPRLTLKQM